MGPVANTTSLVLRYIRRSDASLALRAPPKWLQEARWKPELCLARAHDRRILAVDLIPSGAIPQTIYRQEVARLLAAHKNLRVVVCVMEEAFRIHPEVQGFCKELGVGLKVLFPGLGLETVTRTDLDPLPIHATIPEDGWFPNVLLERARGLQRLSYAAELDRFCREIGKLANDQDASFRLVRDTLDRLLNAHPTFRGNFGQFMRLAHFESLLRMTAPEATEHVFHSFRVFLAGCPVVNQFYEHFRQAHNRFCVGDRRLLSAEYAWLLASVFHDVGLPKEGVAALVHRELQDEDMEVSVRGRDTRWLHPEYQAARAALGSLGVHVANYPDSGDWDGGRIPDADAEKLATEWTQSYDLVKSHAIIGALDFLATAFKTAIASDERRNRPFVLTHAVPAALAILLHDWRTWKDAKTWRLFPVRVAAMPMAALLIYLDTWDDYKRKAGQGIISVRSYIVNENGATVTIEWGDSEALEKEKIKYEAFKDALQDFPFRLEIRPQMAAP